MNYGSKGTQKRLRAVKSRSARTKTKLGLSAFKLFLVGCVSLILILGCMGFGVLKGMLDSAPDIKDIDVSPQGFFTTIYDSKGNEIQTLVKAGANREEVSLEQIPDDVINAFIAIEDERFWTHNGIDVMGIVRAFVLGVVEGDFDSGASTITQQLIKNNVFGGGMEKEFGEKLERKVQEWKLAVELTKTMSKEEVLENYLNTINLANNTLGIQSAATRYFDKSVSDLTLSEGSVLAAITSSPENYDPVDCPENNAKRRRIVLSYMVEQEYITQEEMDEALKDNVYERIAAVNTKIREEATGSVYSSFVDSLIDQVLEDLYKLGYTKNGASNLLYSGGLKIYTTQDPDMQAIVDKEISDPENYTEERYGLSWRFSILRASDGETVNYSEGHIRNFLSEKAGTSVRLIFDSEEEVKAAIQSFKEAKLQEGDKILGEVVDITLQPQASFVLIDHTTGQVKAISNGRGEKTSSLSLRRATASLRQPGSCFKVLAAFAPALDTAGDTLSSVYYDGIFTVGTKTIRNWWGNRYVGFANIRHGIIYSMNTIASQCLMNTVSPRLGFQYVQDFGITSLVESRTLADGTVLSDVTASLALGGLTDGVTNLEMSAAYAAIANHGVYVEPILYTKILDNTGRVVIDKTQKQEKRTVLKDTTAFLLTSAMEDSCEYNQLFDFGVSATSTLAKIEGMSTAGKSGTTSDTYDLWFMGYTPYYTAGIWQGYDLNMTVSDNESHKIIWNKIMTQVHEGLEDIGFVAPNGMETASVCAKCGKLAVADVCELAAPGMVITEYYVAGTAPTETCDCHIKITVCTDTGERASMYCPDECREEQVYMVINAPLEGETYDIEHAVPEELLGGSCSLHTEKWFENQEDLEDDEGEEGEGEEGTDGEDEEGSDVIEDSTPPLSGLPGFIQDIFVPRN